MTSEEKEKFMKRLQSKYDSLKHDCENKIEFEKGFINGARTVFDEVYSIVAGSPTNREDNR